MKKVVKDYYFDEPGPQNTDDVVQAVRDRVKEFGFKDVVVASTSGRTGIKFGRALKGEAKVIAISYEDMEPEALKELKDLGVITLEKTHLPLHERNMDLMRNTYYTLGQGFKVAVEVTLIAVDKGVLRPGEKVIAVGGTDRGSDTAIVVKSTSSSDILSKDIGKRLEVCEVICMPIKKKWWE